MFCLKYVISCLIWDKFGLCMNKSQRVTVFAPFQDKGLYSGRLSSYGSDTTTVTKTTSNAGKAKR